MADHQRTERQWLKECVASREYIFKQMIDMATEADKPFRAEAIKWICDNRKWPSRYKFKVKVSRWSSRKETEFRYGWYMVSKDGNYTMEEVSEKGSSTIPYELRSFCYVTNDLKQWYDEEDALEWLINKMEHMLKAKSDKEAEKKLDAMNATGQV